MQTRKDEIINMAQSLIKHPVDKKNIHAIKQCLSALITSVLTTREKLQCFKDAKNNRNRNFGMVVVWTDHSATQMYLSFLEQAANEPEMAPEVFSLLEQRGKDNNNLLANAIGYAGDESNNLSYLALLDTLIDNGIPVQQIFSLETSTLANRQRFCDEISIRQNANVIKKYIALLDKLLASGVSPQQLYDLCIQRNGDQNFRLFKIINKYQKAATAYQFNLLLAKILYAKLKTQALSEDEYKELAFLKEAMRDYIRSLPDKERLTASKQALDITTSLGQLYWVQRVDDHFWIPTHMQTPRLTAGRLAELGADVVLLEKKFALVKADLINKLQQAFDSTYERCAAVWSEIKSADLPAAMQLDILLTKSKANSSHLGMILAQYKQFTACQEYLTLLKEILAEVGVAATYNLLTQANRFSCSLFDCIVDTNDEKTLEQYLDLFISLQRQVTPRNRDDLLKLQVKDQTKLTHYTNYAVVYIKNDRLLEKYLIMLSELRKTLSAQQMIDILKVVNGRGYTPGSIIVRKHPACVKSYLTLLFELLNDVASQGDVAAIKACLTLCLSLSSQSALAKEMCMLLSDKANDKSFIAILTSTHPELVDEVLNTGLLPSADEIEPPAVPVAQVDASKLRAAPIPASALTDTSNDVPASIYPPLSDDKAVVALSNLPYQLALEALTVYKARIARANHQWPLDDSPIATPAAAQASDRGLPNLTEIADLLDLDSQPPQSLATVEAAEPTLSSGLAGLSFAFFQPAETRATVEQVPAQSTGPEGEPVPRRVPTQQSRNRVAQLA